MQYHTQYEVAYVRGEVHPSGLHEQLGDVDGSTAWRTLDKREKRVVLALSNFPVAGGHAAGYL